MSANRTGGCLCGAVRYELSGDPIRTMVCNCKNCQRTSGSALLTIINDILDFSKIEAGRLELENNSFELRQCVEEVLDLQASKAIEQDIELVYRLHSNVPMTCMGDD